MADSAALLVDDVLPRQPMRQWVLSVPFPLRFLFACKPKVMGKVLSIVYRTIATHLTRKAGYTKTTAQAGAVTLIQCFGGALNLNIHFHMLFLDGVYTDSAHGPRKQFCWVKAPTSNELTHTIARRVGRYLERQGLLVRDAGNSYLTAEGADADNEAPMNHLLGSSVTSATAPALLYLLHPCSRTALPWDHNKVARYSPYRPYPTVEMIRLRLRWAKQPVSHCMRLLLPGLMNGINWNACVVILPDRRFPPNACQ